MIRHAPLLGLLLIAACAAPLSVPDPDAPAIRAAGRLGSGSPDVGGPGSGRSLAAAEPTVTAVVPIPTGR